jgi:hypothetical protein
MPGMKGFSPLGECLSLRCSTHFIRLKRHPMSDPGKRSERGPFLYIILVLLLLLINGVLFYRTAIIKKEAEELGAQKKEAELMVEAMNQEVNDYLLRLENYRTDNATLVGVRDSLRTVILEKQKEIQKTLHQKNFSERRLSDTKTLLESAKAEIDGLMDEKNTYVAALDSMATALNVLQLEYDDLSDRYGRVQTEAERTAANLEDLDDRASTLVATTLTAEGIRERSSGKEKLINRAKRVEQLKICFNLGTNRVLEPGSEQVIYLKIIGPDGVTLSTGENVFLDRDNGEESIYTHRYTFPFNNNAEQLYCTYYDQPGVPFAEGAYQAMLFHRGRLIGQYSFELK